MIYHFLQLKTSLKGLEMQLRLLVQKLLISGVEAAYKLCENFGGNSIYAPKSDSITKRLRDNSIKRDYKNGASIQQLCLDYNLSSNQVRVICSMAYLRQMSINEYLDESE